jgi:putative toxin-antitoxin system antitoxin component (TIGR02293 family)
MERTLDRATAAREGTVGIGDLLARAGGGQIESFDGRSIQKLKSLGFSMDELYRIVAPRRTLARRIQNNEALTLRENDSAQRLVRVGELADRVFGDTEKARRWLRKPSRALGDVVPVDLLESETGAHLVEEELHRIDFGIFA